jgi:hypothetical protein
MVYALLPIEISANLAILNLKHEYLMSPSVRFGIMNGAVAVFWTMLMYVTGLNRTDAGQTINYIAIIFPFIFMFYAIKEFRLHKGHGFISFGQGFKEAFKVGLIGGLMGLIFMLLYMKVIDPGYLDYQMQKQVLQWEESGMGQEQIDQMLESSAWMQTPLMFTIIGGISMLFMSAVFATIMAGVLKKPNPEEIS